MTTNNHSVLNDKFYIIEISFIEYRNTILSKNYVVILGHRVLVNTYATPIQRDKTRYTAK